MSISRIAGQMLQANLYRDGNNLSFSNTSTSGSVLYIDVGNNRIGVNTDSPSTDFEVVGNIAAGNLNTSVNIIAGNVTTSGSISAIGNITGGNLVIANNIGANTANITGNVTVGNISTVGNIAAGYVAAGNVLTDHLLYANGTPWDLQDPAGSNTQIQFNNNSNFGATANFTFDTAANLLTVNATANIANVNVVGNAIVQGNVNGGNILTGGTASVIGNVAGGNILTNGLISATGNITSGNLIIANTTIIAIAANSTITLEPTGTGVVNIDTTTGLVIPVGNTAQQPNPATLGTIRYNTDTPAVEVYTGNAWATVGAPTITNQTLYGNGVQNTFTLTQSTSSAAALIMLNGVVQIPGIAYSMSPDPSANLVFSEAPSVGDAIDVRFL